MHAPNKQWFSLVASSRWRYPLMLIAAFALSPILTRIGRASDDSMVGVLRNGVTTVMLLAAAAYLITVSRPALAGPTKDDVGGTLFRWTLRVGALVCALGACALVACFSGAYPTLYSRVVSAVAFFFAAGFMWFLSISLWDDIAEDSKPWWSVCLFPVGAVACTLSFCLNAFTSLQDLHLLQTFPRVLWDMPTLPASKVHVDIFLGLFGCIATYFMVNTTRSLLLSGSPSSLLIALVAGAPATLVLSWTSLAMFFFVDSPFRTPVAMPFLLAHILLIGYAAAGVAPPGVSHWLRWRVHCREKRLWRARNRHDAQVQADAQGTMSWLLRNYATMRFPQRRDVFEALCDVTVIGEGSDGRIPWHGSVVVRKGERIVITYAPCYIRAPDRVTASLYLTQRLRAGSDSGSSAWPGNPAIRLQGYCVDLQCVLEQFSLVREGESDSLSVYDEVSLEGLSELDEATAVAISRFGGRLKLDTITTLCHKAASALQQHSGCRAIDSSWEAATLSLNGLTVIDEETAKALAAYGGSLSLSGLITLADNVARSLSQHRNRLSLDGLTKLSLTALAALRARQNPAIGLPQVFACGTRLQWDCLEIERAYERSRAELGDGHRDTVVLNTWLNVAKMRSSEANEDVAKRKAFEISLAALGEGHTETIALESEYKLSLRVAGASRL